MMNTCVSLNDLTLRASFPAQLTLEKVNADCTRLCAAWNEQDIFGCEKPHLEMLWSLPLRDIEYEWFPSCSKNRALHVDWNHPERSRISASAPVFCFYNTEGRNRLTVALSDVLSEIFWKLGVHEEDGTLSCSVTIPIDPSQKNYTAVLYRNREDIRFAQALRRVSKWWEKDCHLTPMPVPEAAQLPLYSAWYSFHQHTIAHELEEECARAVKLGMKTIIVDDGWQTDDNNRGYGFCGDWQCAKGKIPDMRAHIEKIHALGMKYMLWYGLPLLGEWSEHFETFKNMTLRHMADSHVYVLDPRFAAVRSFLTDILVRALKEWNPDGFKLDFIDSILPNSRCPAPTAEMDYANVEQATLRLMTDIMTALREIKPDIMIEFRQSYIGPAMRTYGNMFRVADCPADALTNRVGVIDLRLLSGSTAVHSDMLMWHPTDRVENAARQVLGAIFGVVQVSMRLDRLPEDHIKMLRFYLDFMTKHEKLLHAPIDVESPQNLYPAVRTRLGDEEAVALYEQFPAVLSDAKTAYLFNATASRSLIIRTQDAASLHVTAYDCTGEIARCYPCASGRIHEISVPEGGMAVIRRI